jgi:putative hydrolase of the HAD superfamily
MKKIDVFLFDLGRVLVELDGPPIKSEWLEAPISDIESWRRWGESRYVKAFESGEISVAEFTEGIQQEQNLNISPFEFEQAFTAWPKGLYEGVGELLKSLKSHFTLAFYSNTSELHVPRLLGEMGLGQYFDYTFTSCETGHFKPAKAGYQLIIDTLNVPAERILFIDDNSQNVLAAQSLGMNAEQAEGFSAVNAAVSRWRSARC